MANHYKDMLDQGLITPKEYEEFTGEKLENTNSAGSADPGLENLGSDDEKNSEASRARAAKLAEMGLTGGYKMPTAQELARADAVARKDEWEGDGFKCPYQHRRVRTCPVGNIYACERHVTCEFAMVVMSRAKGNRSIGNMTIADESDRVGEQISTAPEEVNTTLAEQAASQGNNKTMTDQALAIMKMRREMKARH